MKITEPIELEVWEPSPDHPGMLRYVRGRPVADIFAELRKRLGKLARDCDYFDVGADVKYEGLTEWPRNVRWIACFAVTGGSEGHYVHVEAISNDSRKLLFLGKTFNGMAHAQRVAAACAKHLGA